MFHSRFVSAAAQATPDLERRAYRLRTPTPVRYLAILYSVCLVYGRNGLQRNCLFLADLLGLLDLFIKSDSKDL